ncbi:OLC1v1025285C1 [Oldenlandia corymbosa var. corymbosa]|uniref:OLC1v1025285C1 n=1 Tax=Oldenlandia corymbosa var. corymbosa TaxID=529605 RepID=A0AAV1C634_OLDCO|nr:OLC1v1025285C1 [Oldenlandia corymbosa var. corymbosa]
MGTGSSKYEASEPQSGDQGKHTPLLQMHGDEAAGKVSIPAAPVLKFPHNHEQILKEADEAVDRTSTEKLFDQLYHGVFLNQHNKAKDSSYWRWPLINDEPRDSSLVAAELINVCWLEVHGRFNTVNLTPRTLYEVVFVVMLKDPAYGWEVPINFRLSLPDGSRQEHKENMIDKPRAKWIEIPAGNFQTLPENIGEMEISLYEYDGGIWKKGLLIKGVLIRPKH